MTHARRTSAAWLATLAVILAACGGSTGLPAPSAMRSATSSASASATASATSSQASAALKPAAPSKFTATPHQGPVPCPSASDVDCSQTDLTWQSTAAAGTWFRIYEAWTGEGGATCVDAQGDATVVLETKPDAKTAQLFAELSTGGGQSCLWITALNNAGESAQIPAVGQ